MNEKVYIAIDLKSFYASVECRERGLNPLTTNLVVADRSRTEKTICLAVTPSLKAYGISGRPRLFEVVQKVGEVNYERRKKAPGYKFSGASCSDIELKADPSKELAYITAPPRMAYYMQYSTNIYNVYLKYFSAEDIVVYSIDEVFIDATSYLSIYKKSPHDIAMMVIQDILKTTGITATAGIGENLYLCKVAMDIVAKHIQPDKDGVRIAELTEEKYRRELWSHRPLTDFWRVGKGYAKKLESIGLYTMGDVARCSVGKYYERYNEDLLYKMFGINAELLIDHAWGWEPVTIEQIKAYKPATKCLCSGQVLQEPYTSDNARIVVKEMTDTLALDLVDKGFMTNQLVLTIGYDIENLTNPQRRELYDGEITTDTYGRQVPKHAHGTENLGRYSSSSEFIMDHAAALFDRIVDKELLIRRITITANNILEEKNLPSEENFEQLNLFDNPAEKEQQNKQKQEHLDREHNMQKAMIGIKKKYGKNAILKGMNFQKGATAIERNGQIGGHKA